MKRSKFSDSQIVDAVKRVEAGIGDQIFFRELGRFRWVITVVRSDCSM